MLLWFKTLLEKIFLNTPITKEAAKPFRSTSMNMTQLKMILQLLEVPEHYYDLSGEDCDGRFCFAHKDDTWAVYDSERGGRFREVVCDNETDACFEILKRMMHLPMT